MDIFLKNCKFCGSSLVDIFVKNNEGKNKKYRCECYSCGGRTGNCISVEEAVKMWNGEFLPPPNKPNKEKR